MTANIDNKLRKAIYRRDGFRCALCDSTDGLQIHHVVPRGRGGSRTNPHNLITLCWRCHAAAHGSVMFLDDYVTVAPAAPATPQRSTRMNSRSSATFSTVEPSRNSSGVTESPMLRRKEQMKL